MGLKYTLQKIKEVLDKTFNDNFCTHLLDFLIEEHISGKTFFEKIDAWNNTYVLKKENIELFGIEGWNFDVTLMEFLFDFYKATQQEIKNYILIMFLIHQFSDLSEYEYNRTFRTYDEEFFQEFNPAFNELFSGKELLISDFEKNMCDDFQYEFSNDCITQLTKDSFIQELENYEKDSSSRFSYYCNSPNTSGNYEIIARLKKEYPKYQNMITQLKNDEEILQVLRLNEHNCENATYYLIIRQNYTYFLVIEDYI